MTGLEMTGRENQIKIGFFLVKSILDVFLNNAPKQ